MADAGPVQNPIDTIPGATNILLIAPHGHDKDDENTGALTRMVAEQSGSYAIINEYFRKPDPDRKEQPDKEKHILDLNKTDQVKTHLKKEFLDPLLDYKNKIVKKFGNAIILWIHGADDDNLKKDIPKTYDVDPDYIKVLIGWGQRKNRNRHTADHETLGKLTQLLNENGLDAVLANPEKKVDLEKKIYSYCGWDRNNMNQLFRVDESVEETRDYQDRNVESFQLEFKWTGCRRKSDLKSTSENLMRVVSSLVSPPKTSQALTVFEPFVEKAYQKLASVFSKNYEQAIMEAGQYIVRTFYGGEENIEDEPYDENIVLSPETIENARKNSSQRKETLNQLYERMGQDPKSKNPSKAWIYNAVNLIVQWHDMRNELKSRFHTYRKLLLSQKIILLKANKTSTRLILCEEEDQKKTTVEGFKKRLLEIEPPSSPKPLSLPAILKKPEELVKEENSIKLTLEELKGKQERTLNKLKKIADKEYNDIKSKIEVIKKDLETWDGYSKKYIDTKNNIEQAIKFKTDKSKPKTDG